MPSVDIEATANTQMSSVSLGLSAFLRPAFFAKSVNAAEELEGEEDDELEPLGRRAEELEGEEDEDDELGRLAPEAEELEDEEDEDDELEPLGRRAEELEDEEVVVVAGVTATTKLFMSVNSKSCNW